MALGGRFAPTMPRPVHARGDQWNGRRIDQMNRSLELASKSLPSFATDKARREIAQVIEHRPEEFLGHLRRAHLIGVGKIIAAGRSRSSQARQRPRMQPEGITHVVESDAMGQLRIQQRDDMTPRAERPNFLLYARFPRQLRNQKVGNEVAYLPKQIQFRRSWNAFVFFFHPCRVAGLNRSFQLFLQIPMGWL